MQNFHNVVLLRTKRDEEDRVNDREKETRRGGGTGARESENERGREGKREVGEKRTFQRTLGLKRSFHRLIVR